MSLSYTCSVHCDGCGVWIGTQTGNKPSGLATRALKQAKQNGWSRDVKSWRTDLCPDCLADFQISKDTTNDQ